jgi:hypothetical protein
VLYIRTVFCRVYKLRSEWGKLPRDVARAQSLDAWLRFDRTASGAPTEYAWLSHSRDGDAFDELSCAHVRFIRSGGIMIWGFERPRANAAADSFRQAWWCVPVIQL